MTPMDYFYNLNAQHTGIRLHIHEHKHVQNTNSIKYARTYIRKNTHMLAETQHTQSHTHAHTCTRFTQTLLI